MGSLPLAVEDERTTLDDSSYLSETPQAVNTFLRVRRIRFNNFFTRAALGFRGTLRRIGLFGQSGVPISCGVVAPHSLPYSAAQPAGGLRPYPKGPW